MKYGEIVFMYDDVPFNYLSRYGNAINLRLGDTVQKVFVPLQYFDKIGNNTYELKDKTLNNLAWFFKKRDVINKIRIYKGVKE